MFLWWIPWFSQVSPRSLTLIFVCLFWTLVSISDSIHSNQWFNSGNGRLVVSSSGNFNIYEYNQTLDGKYQKNAFINIFPHFHVNWFGKMNHKRKKARYDSIFTDSGTITAPNINKGNIKDDKDILSNLHFYTKIFDALQNKSISVYHRVNKSSIKNEVKSIPIINKDYVTPDGVRRMRRSINEYELVSPSKIVGLKARQDSMANLGPGLPRRSKHLPSEDKEGMGGSALNPSRNSNNQWFATQPAPQTAVIGSTVVLPCRVVRKVGHLQWTKDGFGLGTDRRLQGFSRYSMIGSDDEGDFTLRIYPVHLQDDAIYQCQVSASDGVPGIQTKPIRLTVYVPPDPPQVIPPELETTAGIVIELQCLSKGGRPASEIIWVDDYKRENIQLGATDSVVPMDDGKRTIVTSKLTFTPHRHHNNQTITCLASNQALSSPVTASIRLHVLFLPDVTLTSHPDVFREGDNAVFYCDSVANPSAVTYSWYHNNKIMSNETMRGLKVFKISRTYHQDSISCQVTNKVGASKKSKTIYVNYRPRFRTLPDDVRVEIGSTVNLSCDVDSNPVASISWMKMGSSEVIGSGASLHLEVTSASSGTYKCLARIRGRDFPQLEGSLNVLVKGPPKIVSNSEQQGRMGDTVSLECSTVSIPSPIRVTWTYKGKAIDLEDPRYSIFTPKNEEVNHRNILVIHDTGSTDFGDYNCSVVNEYGVARKLITLKQEQEIPVLLIVSLVIAIVVIAVVVVSLVFCNKGHPLSKGPTETEKHKSEEPFAPVTNMYSAASDVKLDDISIGSTIQVPLADVKVVPVPSKRPFVKDDTSLAYNRIQPNINGFSSPTQVQRETMKSDYSSFMESLASSTTDDHPQRPNQVNASLYFQMCPRQDSTGSAGTSEFCTIRRTPRNIKVTAPAVGERQLSEKNSLHFPNTIIMEPDINSLHRRSAFIPHTYSPPPPPPYPRNKMSMIAIASEGNDDSKREFFEGDGASTNEEAKYIFSSEAMLKPGTLV